MRNHFIIAIALILFVSCNRSNNDYPDFKQETEAEWEFLTGDILINMSSDLYLYKDYLILFAKQDDKCMHIYNKHTGMLIDSHLSYGRGSKEVITGHNQVRFDSKTGVFTIFDFMKKTRLRFQFDELLDLGLDAITEELMAYDNCLRYCYAIDDETLLYINSVSLSNDDIIDRIVIRKDNEIIYSYDRFPVPLSNVSTYLYLYSHSDLSPNKKHLAIGTSYGAHLELFNLERGIQNSYSGQFGDYLYKQSGNNVDIEGSTYGFYDFFATDNEVYCIFDGKNTLYSTLFYTNIAIFNWDGNPECLIKTNQKLEKICVDSVDNTIYAVTWTDGIYRLARLKIK